MNMEKYILRANNIYKKFGKKIALEGLNINISKGSICGILGPNGAGKTTLIRLINLIQKPDKGLLIFEDKPINNNHLMMMGYLPEERGLYHNMNVEDQIIYLARLKGMKKNEAKLRLSYLLKRLEIEPLRNKKIGLLSKGMAQKVQFIVSIIHSPKFITFDEPFSGFDPINIKLISDYIIELKNNGVTILLSTHNMSSVELLCDHIILIDKSIKIFDSSLTMAKEKFKSNIFQIKLNIHNNILWNNFKKKYNVYNDIYNHSICDFEIKNDKSYTNILKELVCIGDVLLYKEYIPTINDIFTTIISNYYKK